MTYQNWKALDPRLVPFMTRAFSGKHSLLEDLSLNFFYHLSKKPGKPEVRPILLLKGMVKHQRHFLLLKMLEWIQENVVITYVEFG
jgi:hypothetical protein